MEFRFCGPGLVKAFSVTSVRNSSQIYLSKKEFSALGEGSANCCSWAKSCSPPTLVNSFIVAQLHPLVYVLSIVFTL